MTDREILRLHDDDPFQHPFIVIVDHEDRHFGKTRGAHCHTNSVDLAREYAEENMDRNPKIWQRPKRGKTWTERTLT